MLDDIYLSNGDEVERSRLARLIASVKTLVSTLSTREDLQAEIFSDVNSILSLGNSVSPLSPVGKDGPAIVGDVTDNLTILNNDAQDILKQLQALEAEAANLFNLTAATQNALRQRVRELAYITTQKKYFEPFVTDTQLDRTASTANFDFGVGMATNSFQNEIQVVPSLVEVGVNSIGSLQQPLSNLMDGDVTTAMVWSGSQVELVFTFPAATIVNRIRIQLDSYQGLTLQTLTSTPDGIIQNDLTSELPENSNSLDGSSNKFSGDYVIDFDPVNTIKIRMVIADNTGTLSIGLREVSFWLESYSSSGLVQSKQIVFPDLGLVAFDAVQYATDALTSITHQISYDGSAYFYISPGQTIDLGSVNVWYRAALQRLDENFTNNTKAPIQDPVLQAQLSSDFTVTGVSVSQVGSNILSRSITVNVLPDPSSGTRVLNLWETPIPGTLSVFQGTAQLGPGQFTLNVDKLIFSSNDERDNVTIQYQTSAAGKNTLAALRSYYTPRLYEVSFERID